MCETPHDMISWMPGSGFWGTVSQPAAGGRYFSPLLKAGELWRAEAASALQVPSVPAQLWHPRAGGWLCPRRLPSGAGCLPAGNAAQS